MTLASSAPVGAYQQQSVTTAANLASIPSGATYAVLSVEGNAIRWRDDGTDPTATVGMPVAVGQTVNYDGSLSKLRMIAQTGTATVNVSYYAARHP